MKAFRRGAALALMAACFIYMPSSSADKPAAAKAVSNPTAVIETSMGSMTVEFFPKYAPMTVANFIGLAKGTKEFMDPQTQKMVKRPYYDGLIFHRVIPRFMIQGGDPTGTGRGGPGYRFPDELSSPLKFDKKGVVAMANAGPDTNGSQFFITVDALPSLPNAYTIFGQVIEGVEVAEKISQVARDGNDRPNTPVTIRKVTIK